MNVEVKAANRQLMNKSTGLIRYLRSYSIVPALIIIIIVLSFVSPVFMTSQNILSILRQISINGILAIGVTFVIIAGGIDLSLGSVVGLSGVVAASFAHPGMYALIVPVSIGLLSGAVIGLVNGTVITRGKVAPFIVTLGMMTICRGLALITSNGRPVSNLSSSFNFIGGGNLAGIPFSIIIFVSVIILSVIILNYTRTGRYLYATGGNENAAWVSGVNTRAVKLFAYTLCGMLAGLSGVILSSRINTGQPNAGVAYELDAIAAVVIGGASLSGGVGTIMGTVAGALIIGIVNNGLDLLNITSYYQQIIKGAIIIGAVLMDRHKSKQL